jgi:hypothetical protein
MRILYSITLLLLISCSIYSQGETPKISGELKLKDYKFPTIEVVPKIELPKATIGYKSILTKKEDIYLKKFTFKKEEKVAPIMVEKEKGYDFDEDRKNNLNNRLKEATTGNQKTQYLGEFTVETDLIKIMCRDHQDPDGDVVSILLDDIVVVRSIILEAGFKTFYVSLKKGSNRLDFMALNQGTAGPNTAAFVVFDETGKQIASSEWNLNTGVKASLVIVNKAKDNVDEEKKTKEEEKTE